MKLDVTRRREVYLRDRSELTPAQRRRMKQKLNRETHNVVTRASRLRKGVEKRAARRLRQQAIGLINAMRSGMFSPKVQRELRAAQTLAALRDAVPAETTEATDAAVEA